MTIGSKARLGLAQACNPLGDDEPRPPGVPTNLIPYLDSVRQGLLLVDVRGRVVLCSERARRLLELGGRSPRPSGSLTSLMRAGARGASRACRRELNAALRVRSAGSIEVNLGGHALQVDLQPVPGGGWAATLEDVSARRAALAEAAAMARLDPLTNLPNRLMLRERLEAALTRCDLPGEACAILLVDLDRFKPVNDTLGHPIGDALLHTVADRLRSIVQPTDVVARIGGDEFVILQTGLAKPAQAQALARRIVDLIGRTYMIEGHLLTIGASVGVALAPSDGDAADRLMKCADLALYRAKLDGRGTFRFFQPEMDARMQMRRTLELDMRQALARREFQLHYEPQINVEDNRLVGCEALLRWHHPERGTVAPADFIPLAEEIGLIVQIGEWVLRQACREAVTWPDPMSVAVNLSPAQFKSDRLVETVMSALTAAGLPARRLELEITEGVLLHENDTALKTLHRLRDLGVRVSMDDFGTGYSSLSYLRSFPFDRIKIDRSFVNGQSEDPDADAIVRAIAGLGKSLGMTTVAEGVATKDQMDRLRAKGCSDVQGYLVGQPVSAAEIMDLIGRSSPYGSSGLVDR